MEMNISVVSNQFEILRKEVLKLTTTMLTFVEEVEDEFSKQKERILELERALFVRQADCQFEEEWDEEHNEWDWDDMISIPEDGHGNGYVEDQL